MSDFASALPIRSELVGQVVYQDIITKLGDATNPTTQQAMVDTHGSQYQVLADSAGNLIGDQLLSATYWLQVVTPDIGPAAPGTAATYSTLVGGIYNSGGETLTNGQQSSLQLTSTGALIVSATLSYDTNYGTVGANTLRTAAEIGNATGAANFNWGTVGAQTLRVAAQIGNATGAADFGAGATDAQTLRVASNLYDGSGNPIASQALGGNNYLDTVGPNNGSSAPGTASAYASLVGGVYNSGGETLTNGQQSALQLTSTGALIVTGAVTLPYDTNYGTVGANTLRAAAEIGNATGAADFNYGTVGAQTLRVAAELGNATGSIDYNNGATDAQTIRVAANLAVAGANVSSTNPVPVSIVSTTPGTAIQSYYTSVNLAAGASVTFTYTVAATHTFNFERVWSSSAVKIKSLVQNNGTTIFVGFNSTANPNIDMTITAPPLIAAGNTASVTITNEDLVASDVYCTIEGNQN
jgi:hypothetical protein